jgi:hypothetical protein
MEEHGDGKSQVLIGSDDLFGLGFTEDGRLECAIGQKHSGGSCLVGLGLDTVVS